MNTWQRFGVTVSMCVLLGVVAVAQVSLPHHEPFNYTVGEPLGAQPGWAGLNSGDTLFIAAGSLSYPGLAASSGNKLSYDGAGQEGAKEFTLTSSGTVYYSYLLKVTGLGSLDSTGGYFTTFYQSPTSTTGGSCVWTRLDGSKFDIGISVRISSPVSWSSVKSLDSTYFIVASYEFVDGATNDVCKIWINPDVSTFGAGTPPPETLTSTNNATDLTGVARVQIRQDSPTKTPFIELDELRIATTWAGVTPASGSTAVDDHAPELAPREMRLEQNYPNPFNPSSDIQYQISESGSVRLAVYDLLGREVAVLVNEMKVPGSYEVKFDAAGMASGAYLYRLTAGTFVQTRKMVLVR